MRGRKKIYSELAMATMCGMMAENSMEHCEVVKWMEQPSTETRNSRAAHKER